MDKINGCINASGRMTKLGVSTQSHGVKDAMNYGASNYFLMDDLYRISGETLASLFDAPDAVITSSASAGISLSVAAVLCKDHDAQIQKIHDSSIQDYPHEIVLPKGHNVDFGAPIQTMIETGGGCVIEAGYANKCTQRDVELCINEKTAALMYVKSSHCVQKDMLSLEEMLDIARHFKKPLILDCAAEIDFTSFAKMGIDYVIYSGSKALMGPTSGFVLVQSQDDAINLRKHIYGVGRGMKIGKENIFGLIQAAYEYTTSSQNFEVSYDDLDPFIETLNTINGVYAQKIKDESGRDIYRAKVHFDAQILGISAHEIIHRLEKGTPQIFTRNYDANQGMISFDPRPLQHKNDLDIIIKRIKEVLSDVEVL